MNRYKRDLYIAAVVVPIVIVISILLKYFK